MSTQLIQYIAEAYVVAPNELHTIPQDVRVRLQQIVNKMFGHLSYGTFFEFTTENPYGYVGIQEVLEDYNKGVIKVNISGNDSELWGPVYNLMFRAVHDFVHCDKELDFNYSDEVNAYIAQIELTKKIVGELNILPSDWDLYKKILRSEIIYQAAVKTHFDKFHLDTQKIILSCL